MHVGVDEAGRGALAGPVVAAAVMLDPARPVSGLNDSKQLSAPRREALCALIQSQAVAWAVAEVAAPEIDAMNILQASLSAMQQAVQQLLSTCDPAMALPDAAAVEPPLILVDGNQLPAWPWRARAIVGGDGLEPSIMAASIVAKVHRDRWMCAQDTRFPGYGFAQHKGYPTRVHAAALATLGPCAIHRLSYAPVARCRKVVA